MKCFSKNEIETFYFHDAGLKEIKFDAYDIIMVMNGVCVEVENSQNNESYAVITDDIIFRYINAEIIGIDKRLLDSDNVKTIQKSEYGFILDGFHNGGEITYGGCENGNFCLELFNCRNELFDIYLCFDEVTAEWEYTSDKAWYLHL